MVYVLICLTLSLAGVAGLQFFYMFYLAQMDREQKNRLRFLEMRCQELQKQVETAKYELSKSEKAVKPFNNELNEEEAWADMLE